MGKITLEGFLRPSQKQLIKRLCKEYGDRALYCKNGFVLVKGQAPVLLVAHLDTVHDEPVRDICTSADGNILMSPQGIGGDDRCGVYALAKVYSLVKQKPWLLFTCDEEIGGVGAEMFCLCHARKKLPTELDRLKFIVEVDRRGSHDAVFYDCANLGFEKYISCYGFTPAHGSFSDISVIAPELDIAAVNLSCGYYNAHTLHEYINRAELERTIGKIIAMVDDATCPDIPQFKYFDAFAEYDETAFDDWDYDADLYDLK